MLLSSPVELCLYSHTNDGDDRLKFVIADAMILMMMTTTASTMEIMLQISWKFGICV